MGRFADLLSRLNPINGYIINSRGYQVNRADIMERQDANNIWPFGETLVGSKRDDIALKYQYPFLNTEFDFRPPTLEGDGDVTQANSVLRLSATTGTAEIESIDATAYRAGHSGYIDFTASFDGTGSAIAGARKAFQIRYNNGALQFGFVKGGEFVGVDVDTTEIDLTKMNVWRIVYGYLGSASPTLFVKQGRYRQVAIVETEGKIERTHVDDPNFTAYYQVSGDVAMESGSFAAGVIDGPSDIGFRTFTFPNAPLVDGEGPDSGDVELPETGEVVTVAVFRSKEVYKTVENTVRVFISLWSTYVESPETGAGSVSFQVIANPTLTGTEAYTDIDTDSSVIEVDHTAGVGASLQYAGGGRVILQSQVPYAAGQGNKPGVAAFDATAAAQLGASAAAGDVFAIVAKDKGLTGVTARSTLGWRERF